MDTTDVLHIFRSVEKSLARSHYHVSSEWLRECFDFLTEAMDAASALSTDVLVNGVLEQWMSSDLRGIGASAFPSGTNWDRSELNGTFNVQVQSVTDVGSSAYSQFRKATGTFSANSGVSAETDTNQPWEPRPTRMLMLSLTDGTTDVQGMEWKPISALSVKLPPGTKIRLKGKIECRKKVLLLSSSNVEIIGGSLDELAVENNYVNVLANILNIEHDPNANLPVTTNNPTDSNVTNDVSDEELLDLIADDDD